MVQDKQAFDPFSDIDFDTIVDASPSKQSAKAENKKTNDLKAKVKESAKGAHFSSREVSEPVRQRLVTKSFSLFADEMRIIKSAIDAYAKSIDDEFTTPSQSDAVRAGLHLLAEKSESEQAELIAKYRGRGRK